MEKIKMELSAYQLAAITSWKGQWISVEMLFEVFGVSFYEAYRKLLDEQNKTGKWFDLLAERIAEILLSCKTGD